MGEISRSSVYNSWSYRSEIRSIPPFTPYFVYRNERSQSTKKENLRQVSTADYSPFYLMIKSLIVSIVNNLKDS